MISKLFNNVSFGVICEEYIIIMIGMLKALKSRYRTNVKK